MAQPAPQPMDLRALLTTDELEQALARTSSDEERRELRRLLLERTKPETR